MTEGIVNASTQMSQLQVQEQAQTSVLKSALDTAEQQGESIVSMLEQSSVRQPAPLESEKGTMIDLFA